MLITYTNLNRREYMIEKHKWSDLNQWDIDCMGDPIWPCNTSFWIVPGSLNPED